MVIVIVLCCLLLISSSAGGAWWYLRNRTYVPDGCVGWWDASSWSETVWKDKSEARRDATILGTTTKNDDAIEGGVGSSIKFIDFTNNPMSALTVIHLSKYRAGATSLGRIFTDFAGFNWISGHHSGRAQVAYHGIECNHYTPPAEQDKFAWTLSVERKGADGWKYRANEKDLCADQGPALTGGYGINGWPTELSEWSVRELLIFDRELTVEEVKKVEAGLKKKYDL